MTRHPLILTGCFLLATGWACAQRGGSPDSARTGSPVTLAGDTLFFIYAKTGSFSAGDRATAISQRIEKLYHAYAFVPDSLVVEATDNGCDLVYANELTVMSVTRTDALSYGTSADSLAAHYRAVVVGEIARAKKANSVREWMRRIGLTALIMVGFGLAVFLLNLLFHRGTRLVVQRKERLAAMLTFRKYNLVTQERLERVTVKLLSMLKVVLVITCGYVGLLLMSGIFKATERWTDTLLGWILTPAGAAWRGFVHFLPDLFTIVVIWVIFRFVIRGVGYVSGEIEKGNMSFAGFHRDWARPTFNIVKFLLYAFMLVLIFPYLPGSASPAFKGVTVFLGVLISLGSSSAINNIVAGLVITYMRPFKVGDRVKIGEVTGDVLEKTMLVTRIRTIKNEDVTVPNSTVLSASSVNYSVNTKPGDPGLILHTTVTIGYDTPWKNMHGALLEAAGRTDLVEKTPEPFVLQTSLDDFYVSYQLNVYTKAANQQAVIYSQLHQHIQDACNEAGIEIMSPHYQAMRDGNTTTIPADYLPKDYQAPRFEVRQQGGTNDGVSG
jgi:small-conductance mechanosensitive channel